VTASEVDAALTLGPSQVGEALLALAEDQWYERKGTQVAAKDLAVPIVALANAEGGVIAVGLHRGAVQGLRSSSGKVNDFRQASIDHISPPARATFEEIECVNSAGEPDKILIIRVDPSERVHELKNGDCYLRVGDESRRLNFTQRQELEYDKGQSQYDGLVARGIGVDDLKDGLISEYRDVVGAREIARLLKARSLLTRSGEVTNAGYLLFGDHPQQDLFPEAYVRVLKFLSTSRGTGSRLGLDESGDIRVEGPIPVIIEEASKVINELLPKRRALGDTGRFIGIPIVPRDAWLEGLVNAVIHRSYSLAGDHIRVEIYPNRIEIESPGRFPGLANPDRPLDINRFARNPRIARVCADLRIGQELGEGIKRMFDEMRRVGLTDPFYKQTPGSVRLTLAATSRLDRRIAARLPRGSQRVLDVMRASDTPLGTGELAAEAGFSRPAAVARLQALQNEGLVRWIGKSKKDPRAVWILVD
jgi:ATP-dependent DNA helicase RecG